MGHLCCSVCEWRRFDRSDGAYESPHRAVTAPEGHPRRVPSRPLTHLLRPTRLASPTKGRPTLIRSAGLIQSSPAVCLGGVANGLCQSDLVSARDYMTAGSYYLDYRVQNFSTDAGTDDVRATIRVSGTDALGNALAVSTTTQDFLNLGLREARTGRATIDLGLVGADDTVSITLSPRYTSGDGFANNNSKIFKIRTR